MSTDASSRALDCAATGAIAAARILPSTFRAAVTRVEEHHQEYRRAAYVVDSRTIRLGVEPAHGTKKSQIGPRPDPRSVDPWEADPSTLPSSTRTVAACPACEGSKKTSCSPCAGEGKLWCDECAGHGRVMGQRGLKNCPSCRGKGDKRCATCSGRGQTKCATCDGLGRVHAWLEVETSRRARVLAHPKTGVAVLHRELELAEDLDRDPSSFPFPLVSDTGWGRSMPPGLGPELIIDIDPFSDRIASRRLQVFGPTTFHCHYEISTGSGVVQVVGTPPQVLPESQWSPWRRRWILSLAVGGLMLLLAVLHFGQLTGRAEWFAQHPSASTIALLGAVAAALGVAATAGFCLPRRARGWFRFRLPAFGVAGAWAWMLSSWLTVVPSPEGVRAAAQRGDTQAARIEAAAVEAVEGSSEELRLAIAELDAVEAEMERVRKQALDDEHLARVKRASSTPEAAKEVALAWEFEDGRRAATEHLLQHADGEMETLFERHDAERLDALADAIEPYDAARASRARARRALARALYCRRQGELGCAVASVKGVTPAAGDPVVIATLEQVRRDLQTDLEQRLQKGAVDSKAPAEDQKRQIVAQLAYAQLFVDLTGQPSSVDTKALQHQLTVVEGTLERQRAREEAEQERQRAREEAERKKEERREARAAKRAEAKRAKAADRKTWGSDRVQCCDGSYSPTCRYGRSLRGCCSHHGGVC